MARSSYKFTSHDIVVFKNVTDDADEKIYRLFSK